MTDRTAPAPVLFVDTVRAVAFHNGNIRIAFIRLDADGTALPALELVMPAGQIAALAKAISGGAR